MQRSQQTVIVAALAFLAALAWMLGGSPTEPEQRMAVARVPAPPRPGAAAEASARSVEGRVGRSLLYGFVPGQVLEYRLSAGTTLAQQLGDARVPVRACVRGILRIRVYEADREGYGLGVRIIGPRMDAGVSQAAPGPDEAGRDRRADATDLDTEVFLRVSRTGRFLQWFTPRRLSATPRNQLRALLAPLQVVLPGDERTRWTAEQDDVLGRFVAMYHLDRSGAISMSKRYLDIHSGTPVAQVHASAEWRARMDARGFLRSLEGRERMRVEDASTACEGTQEYSLELVGVRLEAALRFNPRHDPTLVASGDARPEPPSEEESVGGRAFPGESLDQVLRRLARADTSRSLVLLDLRFLCATDAEARDRALDLLARGALDESGAQVVAMALASSGHAEAEEGLRRLAARSTGDGAVREKVVEALGFVSRAQRETVGALADLARARSEDAEVRRLALQGLGLLASSPEATPDQRQVAALSLLPLQPGPTEDPKPWLLAMQNATPTGGEAACLEVYGRGDASTRTQVLRVLARYDSEAAREALRQAARADTSHEVRQQAERFLRDLPAAGSPAPEIQS